ncbi:hypothetical protein O7626_28850 [Micromonospora sp. WMMD1102]|uniref:hypothetical protein n=1 Tax=Micromonospora sp. WMMD1102 TaxID=3016105 RepID=UPI002414F4DE|nr:hypothetical protein [Micromonospora sp. WMMD1102]MDG4789888.1 hypothetical protein [Micromonospora sp. WMMD1102]
MIVRMWEVRAERAGFADLISWVCDSALPELEHNPLHISSEVFSSTDNRLVVISKWRANPVSLPDPPARMLARTPHFWDFTQVDR